MIPGPHAGSTRARVMTILSRDMPGASARYVPGSARAISGRWRGRSRPCPVQWTVALSDPPNRLPGRLAVARWSVLSLLLAGCQCGTPAPVPDGGGPGDAGGAMDSGAQTDAGAVDAGTPDAGAPDAGPSPTDAGGPHFYGPGIGADSLDNHQVAGVDVDVRFRAATSAKLLSLRWYNIYTIKCAPHASADAGTCPADCAPSGAVYACGTGGTMHICLQGDDGSAAHLADGVDLACLDHVGASAPPFCSSSTEMPSGERTNAMRPSRGGRLMVTPPSISRWQAA